MWTPETRTRHDRDHLRYGSDLTDEEWRVLAPFLPPPAATGRRRLWPMREMLNCEFRRKPAGDSDFIPAGVPI